MTNFLLKPLSSLFAAAVQVRAKVYAQGLIPVVDVGLPVISIGNLTVGGTGKTPLVDLLVRRLQANAIKTGVVSRGYKSSEVGPIEVDAVGSELAIAAKRFGDEPTMIKWRNPTTPVVIGRDRVAACYLLKMKYSDVRVILADDAFQHWRLKRNLDIVVLDCSDSMSSYQMLPVGRARESFEALKRADFIVLNKINLASPGVEEFLLEQIYRIWPHWKSDSRRILRFKYKITGLTNLKTGKPEDNIQSRKYFLVSGIARSQTFRKLLENDLGIEVVGERSFPDHFDYSLSVLEKIVIESQKFGASRVLMTEKDAVKFQKWTHDELVFSNLEMVSDSSLELFDEQIHSLFS